MSNWKPVTSGIPQGSVLGPLLFVCYINDLPDHVKSCAEMFADDTKVWRNIIDKTDVHALQTDLDNLVEWSNKWQLGFNTSKCKVVHLGPHNGKSDYSMGGADLAKSEGEKDLGVVVDIRLSFEQHIDGQVSKANRALGLIRRSFTFLDGPTMKTLFKALVRPHLEYGVTAWRPASKGAQIKIECSTESDVSGTRYKGLSL